jgi:hypothetical protein
MNPKDLKFYLEIDKILYSDWNPIGIKDLPRDEYQSYTYQIFALKYKGSNIETIAQALYNIETTYMGLAGNMEFCRRVATKIFNI